MPDITIKLEGAHALDKALAQLPVKDARKVLRKAMRAGAKVFQQEAKALVPVETGRFKRSLVVRAARHRRGEIAYRVFPSTKKEPGLVTTSPGGRRYYYPAVIEYGSRTRPALAPMRRAWWRKRKQVLDDIMRATWDGISAAAVRLIGPRGEEPF